MPKNISFPPKTHQKPKRILFNCRKPKKKRKSLNKLEWEENLTFIGTRIRAQQTSHHDPCKQKENTVKY